MLPSIFQEINTTHLGDWRRLCLSLSQPSLQLIKQKNLCHESLEEALPCSPQYNKTDTKQNVRSGSWEVGMFREDELQPAIRGYIFLDFAESH